MLAAPAAKREAKVGETGRTLKAEPRRASSFDPAPAGNQAMLRMFAAQRGLQAKPAIDRPGDAYEQEADRVADRVTGGSAAECGGGSTMASAPVQVQRTWDGAGDGIAVADAGTRSTGSALPRETRALMEARFGADFSAVRVHADAGAAVEAGMLGARAFTRGRDIVFGEAAYQPGTAPGRRLLAHELAHVVQQRRGGAASGVVQRQAAEGGAARTPLAEAIWYYHFYIDQMGFTAQDLGGTKVRLTGPGGKADLIDITFDAQAPRMVRIWHSDESYTVTEYDFAARRWEERARHIKMEEYDRELSIGERIGIGVSSTAKLAGGVGACVLGTAETVGFGAVAACAYGADLAASGIREVAGGDDRTLVNQAATAGLSQFIDPQTAQELTNTAEATANIMMGAYGAAKPLPAPKVTPGGMGPAAAAGLTADVPAAKGVSVPVSEMPPNRGPANLNAANDLALARQKAAATARPPGETQVQARPVLATGTGDMAPARVIEAGEAAHDQGALDTRMGKKPTPPVGGSKTGGSKAGGPVRPAETAAGGRTPAVAATVRAAKGLPTAEEDAIVQRYARGLADLRERVQALRTREAAVPRDAKLIDRARAAYESADRALQGIEDEAVTRGEGELVAHLDPLVKERGTLKTQGPVATATGTRVPCDAVAQAPKALRGMDFADIEQAMGRPPDGVEAAAREAGRKPSGHQRLWWNFKDGSRLVIDDPRELGNRAASADQPHAELHGPAGERLDQQGIVVPERSISAHMTITDHGFALENHFGPARASGG